MKQKIKLALIDSHALIHRAYHALPPMTTRGGQPTNAVYGFTTMLLKVLATLKPSHVVAAFDTAAPTFRHTAFAEYKAHRKKADDELIAQFALVRELVEAFNIPVLEQPGFEADDIIGTVVRQADSGIVKVIVTGDMDALQLVDDYTYVYTLRRGLTDTVLYDEAAVREQYGFAPPLLRDYKGLRGDPSDNIPGVAGIGDKTAKQLVAQYGTLEQIYEHLDELPQRARTRLTGHQEEALTSRELATIHCEVPINFDLAAAELADYDVERVRQLFEKFEFRSLLPRLPRSAGSTVQPTLLRDTEESGSNDSQPVDVTLPDNYHLVTDSAEQAVLRKRLLAEKLIAFDTETERLGARQWPIVGMSFAVRTEAARVEAWYVPVTREGLGGWRELLESEQVRKIGHNLKYDAEVVQAGGVHLGGMVFDTMLASYLLHPGARQHGLDTLAVQELGHHCIPITDLIGIGSDQKSMSEVPLMPLARYAAEDAEVSWRLYEVFKAQIQAAGLQRVLDELEVPLVPVLVAIELAGVGVDTTVLKKLEKKVSRRLTELEQAIWAAAGEQFNINSTKQLRALLFERLNLVTDGIRRTKSGYSTAASELAKLHGKHPIIELLEEYRELSKLHNTYITVLPDLVDTTTGRIYASFNQTIAATGRLSGSDPNLQNIPARTELGQEIRSAFVAPAGRQLIKADYSQLELRIAAHIAQDEKMIEAFRAGEDIHRATAAWVQGVKVNQVTDEQRRRAKTLNFGVLYGMGPINFARAAGVSVEEARSFIERYKQQYTGLVRYIEATIAQAEELGYVETLWGRKRLVPEIQSRQPAVRAAAERAAYNFPIQGTAADILKKSMIELHALLGQKYPEAMMVLTVHDELVVEAPAADVVAVARDMKRVMEGVVTLDVPIEVDVAAGVNWRDVEPVDL